MGLKWDRYIGWQGRTNSGMKGLKSKICTEPQAKSPIDVLSIGSLKIKLQEHSGVIAFTSCNKSWLFMGTAEMSQSLHSILLHGAIN